MSNRQIKILVEGSVQGVGFRFFTFQKASQLGLTGYVKNLLDGRVEIVASGSEQQLKTFTDWLEQGGPRSAHITHYRVTDYLNEEQFDTFKVRY